VRTLTGGTATFGTFGNAPYYLLSDLVQDFRNRHPDVRVRLVGLNSSEVADAVRDGHLEGGLIVLRSMRGSSTCGRRCATRSSS
jgi:DNA-binding transcriptional LysR family regulator